MLSAAKHYADNNAHEMNRAVFRQHSKQAVIKVKVKNCGSHNEVWVPLSFRLMEASKFVVSAGIFFVAYRECYFFV